MTHPNASVPPTDGFSDRVMAAIALVAAPSPTRSFLAAIRAGSGSDAMAALHVAWHLGTQRDWPVAPPVRARSFALVLAVASILATGSMVAASAARVIVTHVERSPILDPRGSVILDAGPAIGQETGPARPQPRPERVPVTVVAVPVAEPKDAPVAPARDASDGARPPTSHGGTEGTGGNEPDDGDGGHADDDGDQPSSDEDGHDGADDGEGSDHHDDGEDAGSSAEDEADGEDADHHGDRERDGGDGHESDDDGEESDD